MIDKFLQLIIDAHGGRPDAQSKFVEDTGETLVYDVTLPLFEVTIRVPIHQITLTEHLAVLGSLTEYTTHEEWSKLEHGYQVRAIDAIAYALETFHTQPVAVREYLHRRFNPYLFEAIRLGKQRWATMAPSPQ